MGEGGKSGGEGGDSGLDIDKDMGNLDLFNEGRLL